ncbi:hypothetical protein FPV67DRAFT_1603374 [Lyophyllum atratum]|nr:hypothetical protein FPV67DRAFT_1603374 [Lyophyllum atratum]
MPPPELYTPTPKPHSHPQPHVHTYGSQPASQQQTPPRSQQQHQPQSPSQPEKPKSTRRPQAAWAIWSRRPQDPTHAPGIIISPNAKPPPEVVEQAIDLPTPPPSPVFHTQELEHPDSLQPGHEPEPEAELTPEPAPSSTVPSSSVTETTDRDTPAVGSPVSSATSLSASVDLATKVIVSVSSTAASPATASSLLPTSAPDSIEHQAQPLPTTAPAAPKKSWASLLQASASTSVAPGPGHKRLLASSVVGISVPASALLQPSQPPQPQFAHPALSLPHAKRGELLALLTSPPSTDAGVGPAPAIRPRGLVNAGNMCFANSVLQVLVYCPPFLRLFTELARFGFGFRAEKEKDREGKDDKGPTPLVDAVVEFVREFSFGARRRDAKGGVKVVYKGKGKEREREASGERSRDEEEGASFLPSYVYDAMKEKTVFDGMRSGQQEDAEEFLGFFLDALEEELLAVIQALSPPPPPTPKKAKAKGKKESESGGVEEKEVEEEKEDGWLEVGKRNRMVVTRTVHKSSRNPITRIFGGKVRSTLKAPGQKDSVTVEAWRALRLDISPPSITTLPLALAHMAAPQALETPRQASMQHLLEALPPVLVVHLKRFCYDKEVGGVVKIGKGVRWGEGVEVGGEVMAPGLRRGPAARYRLFGVVYHHGQSASGGHYTLDVLHPARPIPEGWMRIDDELVSDLRADDVFGAQDRQEEEGKAAYMLFYQRVR